MKNREYTITGKTYFVSDCHFGSPNRIESKERELKFIKWLEGIEKDAKNLILLGDIFDFWFEYKYVVPRGYFRLLSKLSELNDSGIKIYYFTGNHDMWIFNYFEKELGFEIIRHNSIFYINNKKVFIGHGDGVGPGDYSYKLLKKIFNNKINIWLYSLLHPNIAFWLALKTSSKSRVANSKTEEKFLGEEKEYQILFLKEKLKEQFFDYFIFGHRHLPMELYFDKTKFINTGDWVKNFSYAETINDDIVLNFAKFD